MKVRARITVSTTLELNEEEIGALDALAGYGTSEFLSVFKSRLGSHYVGKYEEGVRSLFAKVRAECPAAMARVAKARKLLEAEATEAAEVLP